MTESEVLKELAGLRKKINRWNEQLEDGYARQKELYIEGALAGARAPDMARAMCPGEDINDLAETIRQVLREAGLAPRDLNKRRAGVS